MVFRDRVRNFGKGSSKGGFLGTPGLRARTPMMEEGSLPHISIGTYDGPLDEIRGVERSPGAMRQDLPGRRIDTSHRAAEMDSRMSAVLEARRQNKLTAADPGLSTRGVTGAPGRGGRAVTGGLEGRGTPSAGRKRPAPGIKGGTKRGLERRGVRPEPGTRRINPGPNANRGMAGYKGSFNSAFAAALKEQDQRAMGGLKAGYNSALGDALRKVKNAEDAKAMGAMKAGYNQMFGEALQHGRDAEAFARRTGQGTPRVNRRVPIMDTPTGRGGGGGTGGGGGRPPGGTTRGTDRPVREAIEREKGKLFKGKGRGLMIGAGAAVIAGLAYSGRRGEGSSGGRTSMGRY